jgi:site-specific DNA-methyltransferase (adenine-specific)
LEGVGVKPYYEQDGITIYHGDCREVLPLLPDASVDITVTSPPYNQLGERVPQTGSGMHKANGFFQGVRDVGYADDMPEDEYQTWVCGVVRECVRASQGLVWVNHKVRYRDGVGIHPLTFLPFPLYSEVIWDRCCAVALNCRRPAPSHEGFWAFGTPHWWDDAQNKALSVWRIPPLREDEGRGHPCPFPVDLVLRPILASCPPSGVVFDPFMGSGTTMDAARRVGRRFIGCEIHEPYCEIAANRLRQGVLFGAA